MCTVDRIVSWDIFVGGTMCAIEQVVTSNCRRDGVQCVFCACFLCFHVHGGTNSHGEYICVPVHERTMGQLQLHVRLCAFEKG